MKKIRIVVLFFSGFSFLYSIFWLIFLKCFNINDLLVDKINIPLSANALITSFVFIVTLIWYIYELKVREESISSFIIFIIYLAYSIIFLIDMINIYNKDLLIDSKNYLFDFTLTSGVWIIISLVMVFLHFIASVEMNGHDNVDEPTNIFGFVYTIIGFCYIAFILILNVVNSYYIEDVYVLRENGLLYTLVILSYILVAGLRFNSILLNILNIILNFIFTIWFMVVTFTYNENVCKYLCSMNVFLVLPMFVLSIFILIHYINYDRFYKGRTKNFLND